MVTNSQVNDTVDGQPPQDQQIELPGRMDPTAEETQRALHILNGGSQEDLPSGTPKDTDTREAKPEVKVFDDPRDNIAANFRTNRGRVKEDDIDGDEINVQDRQARYGTDIMGDAAAVVEQEQRQEQQQAPAPKIKVKIDGLEKDVTQEELIAAYQKNGTGDVRLSNATREANRILDEARAVAARLPTPANSSEAAPAASERPTSETRDTSTPRAKIDRKALAEAVERIQLGSTEEGVEALGNVLESVAPQQNSTDVRAQVRNVIAADRIEEKSVEATDKFVEKFPELKENAILQDVLGNLVAREMAADFIKIGATPDLIAKTMPSRAHLKSYHDAMRLQNPEFGRPLEVLYEAAAKDTNFQRLVDAKPVPVVVNVNRGERKQMVQQQPAQRTAVPVQQTQQVQLTREQRASQAIAQMQADRGQRVTA